MEVDVLGSSWEVVVLVAVVEVVVHGDGSCTHVRLGEVLDESNIFGATVVVHVVDELGDPKGYLAGRRGTRCRGTCRITGCSRTRSERNLAYPWRRNTKGPQVSVVNKQEADPWTWHLTESSPRGQAGELLLLFKARQGVV